MKIFNLAVLVSAATALSIESKLTNTAASKGKVAAQDDSLFGVYNKGDKQIMCNYWKADSAEATCYDIMGVEYPTSGCKFVEDILECDPSTAL